MHLWMLSVLDTSPCKFRITIKSEDFDQETEHGMSCSLIFTYTKKYPDDPPEVDVEDEENLEDTNKEDLISHVIEQVEMIQYQNT